MPRLPSWSPCMCDVLYPANIRRATGDKARLNPPNQLCFTVLATLPLYIAYRSPYIFTRSTCVHAPSPLTHSYTRYIPARPCSCVHFRPGYVHGCVKRKHQGGPRYRHGTACPCFMVSLIPFREVDLYESRPVRNFILVASTPRGSLSEIRIVTRQISLRAEAASKVMRTINWKRMREHA